MALLQVPVLVAPLLLPAEDCQAAAEDCYVHDVRPVEVAEEGTVPVVESFLAEGIVPVEDIDLEGAVVDNYPVVDAARQEDTDHEAAVDYDFRAGCDYRFADEVDNCHVSD